MELYLNIPTNDSSSQDWINWHKSLLKAGFNRTQANDTFAKAWDKYGSYDANSSELRDYLGSKGFTLESDWTDDTWDFAKDPFGLVTDFNFASGMIKYTSIALVIILILFVAMILFNIARNPEGVAQGIAKGFSPVS